MPITNRAEAKEGGWQQTRDNLQKFEGDVLLAEFGVWPGQKFNDDGTPKPPKEYLEITSINNRVLAAIEELSMDISAKYNFRVNCSDYMNTFWMDNFLGACDNLHIVVPGGFIAKHVVWEKATRQAINSKTGVHNEAFDSTNFIPVAISDIALTASTGTTAVNTVAAPAAPAPASNPLSIALEVAVGKTEAQFRSAIGLHPAFVGSPLLPLAKSGNITDALVKDKKLVLDANQIYRKPS